MDKIYKTVTPKALDIAQQRVLIWEMGNKQRKPYNCPSICLEKAPRHKQGGAMRESQVDSQNWAAEGPWRWGQLRVLRPQYQEGETFTERTPEIGWSSLEYSAEQLVPVYDETTKVQGRLKGPVPSPYVGPGILPIPTSHAGKPMIYEIHQYLFHTQHRIDFT